MKTVVKPIGKVVTDKAAALEALFAQEISGEIAHISVPVARQLCAEGLAEEAELEISCDRFGAIITACHVLTLKGHMTYCQSCGISTAVKGEGK